MAPKKMARVLLRLLTRPTGRAEILDEDGYVVLTQLTGEKWRETFMERFRDEISPFAPAKEARLSFQREMYFSLFSHGDSRFYSNLVSLIENLKAENGQGISLDSVTSGHAAYVPNFDPEFFNNADFDTSRAYNQWMSQKPIGYQIYFQMELQPPKPPLKVGESVLFQFDDHVWMGGWDDAQVVQINDDLTYDIEGENVGSHSNVPRDKLRRFDFDVDEDDEVVEAVENEFRGKIPFLATVTTKDEKPREYGRVVNFSSEVDGDDRPVWWHADDEEDEDEEAYYYR